jgi:hypothetical protein
MGEGDPGALGDIAGARSEVTTIAGVVLKGLYVNSDSANCWSDDSVGST